MGRLGQSMEEEEKELRRKSRVKEIPLGPKPP
jgi:hypothetical protein